MAQLSSYCSLECMEENIQILSSSYGNIRPNFFFLYFEKHKYRLEMQLIKGNNNTFHKFKNKYVIKLIRKTSEHETR